MTDLMTRTIAFRRNLTDAPSANSPLSEKVAFIVKRYDEGAYGTFQNPKRSAGIYAIFWSVALGHREAKEYRGSWDYCFAKAGKIVREREVS